MYIKDLQLENFRCFKDTTIKFDKELSVLVGNNGAGKSTILDALAIALGSFLSGFDGISSNSIWKTDVRFMSYNIGSVVDRQPQFPVTIKCDGNINGVSIPWKRSLNSENGRTTIVDAKQIIEFANEIQRKIRSGNTEIILPLVSYYGSGRLWAQKKQKHVNPISDNTRLSGYIDCLDVMSNDKLMLKWFKKMALIAFQGKVVPPELKAVYSALKMSLSSLLSDDISNNDADIFYDAKTSNITVQYTDNHGEIQKHPLRELSDGYRNTLTMIGDIAYRMAVLNPQLLNNVVRLTPGIVLIDEIDMHLHPSWQKKIINDLRSIFPQVQFIVTTHSPSIISSVPNNHLIVLKDNEVIYPTSTTYGRDVNSVLREIMGVSERQQEVLDKFSAFYRFIDSKEYDKARQLLLDLENIVGTEDPEITNAHVTLKLESM